MDNVTSPDSIAVFLNGVVQDSNVFEGLSSGTYTVVVEQGANCAALLNFDVEEGLAFDLVRRHVSVVLRRIRWGDCIDGQQW